MSDIGTAYVNIVPKASGIKDTLTGQLASAGSSAGQAGGLSLIGKMKGLVAGAAIGATVVAGIKKAIGEGAELEQSLGGIETLFKDSADTVIQNASNAYKTAGTSANDYMQNVTSFAAGLITSLDGDTAKAANIADMAMVDMSDNANKMGTDITSIQNAYQGFAKKNYTMLDNLKLGYGGTKEEMQRLLDDAEKLTGKKYDMNNLSDVYEAIHVIQDELDITGTTAEEAEHTISGSFGSMKAAFSDFMGNLALGRDIGPSMEHLVDTAVTFLVGNLLPAIGNIMMSLPEAISSGIKAAASYVPADLGAVCDKGLTKIEEMLPAFLDKGVQVVSQFGTGIIENLPAVIEGLGNAIDRGVDFIANSYPKLAEAGAKIIVQLGIAIVKNAPRIVVAINKLQAKLAIALVKMSVAGLKAGFALVKEIGSGIANGMKGVIGKVKGFVEKIISPIKGMIDKVKGYFPLHVGKIFSGIRLPKFNVSGGSAPWGLGGKGSMPSIHLSWYAKGGIMTQPTLFGGGEAGHEAIVPLDPFWKRLDKAMGSGATVNATFNINGAENAQQIANTICRKLEMEMRS